MKIFPIARHIVSGQIYNTSIFAIIRVSSYITEIVTPWQGREFNARRANPTRHIPERWIPETAGNLITRRVKLIEQLEGRFNGETKQTHRYKL